MIAILILLTACTRGTLSTRDRNWDLTPADFVENGVVNQVDWMEYKTEREKWKDATTTTTEEPTPPPPVCPGDSHPYLPICSNIQAPLVQKKFTNHSFCIFKQPEKFQVTTATMKTLLIATIGSFGVFMNGWIMLSGFCKRDQTQQREQSRNFYLAVIVLGDLLNIGAEMTRDLSIFHQSYQHWVLGENACILLRAVSLGGTAMSQLGFLLLFIERYAETCEKMTLLRVMDARAGMFVVVFSVAIFRAVVLGHVVRYEDCVLRDGTPFATCTMGDASTSLADLLTTYIVDIAVMHLFVAIVIIYLCKKTLPELEMRASMYKTPDDISNAKFLHAAIMMAMLTLTLTATSQLLHIFADISQYPLSPALYLVFRAIGYINFCAVKPAVILVAYRAFLGGCRELFTCNCDPARPHLEESLGVAIPPPIDPNMTTEELLEDLRALRRQTSMTPSRPHPMAPQLHQRSKSFDGALNSRVNFVTPTKNRTPVQSTPNNVRTPQPCNTTGRKGRSTSRYINLDEIQKYQKQKSDSNLRPKSLYMNIGPLNAKSNDGELGVTPIDSPPSPDYVESQLSEESGYCSSINRQNSTESEYCSISPRAEVSSVPHAT